MAGILFELTDVCDLQCRFCYRSPSGLLPMDVAQRRVVLSDVLLVPGMDSVMFIGGEPLLDPDLIPLAQWIHQTFPHVSLGVSTNGRNLTPTLAAQLGQAGVGHIELPLFTLNAQRYEQLTGEDGLGVARAALSAAAMAGLSVTVGVVLLKTTCDELEQILELAALMGVRQVSLFTLVASGRAGAESLTMLAPAPGQLQQALEIANRKATQLGLNVVVATPGAAELRRTEWGALRWGRCGRGIGKWVMDCAGNLLSCELSRKPLGNLVHQPAVELMTGAAAVATQESACSFCLSSN